MEGFWLNDRQRDRLRRAWRTTDEATLCRRIAAILEVDGGEPIARVAERFGVSRRCIYNWIERLASGTDPKVLTDRPRSGRPPRWTPKVRELVDECLKVQPDSFGYQAVGWTVPLLQHWIRERTSTVVSATTVRRHLHELGYSWKRPRYVLDPDPEREKKTPDSAETSCVSATDSSAVRG